MGNADILNANSSRDYKRYDIPLTFIFHHQPRNIFRVSLSIIHSSCLLPRVFSMKLSISLLAVCLAQLVSAAPGLERRAVSGYNGVANSGVHQHSNSLRQLYDSNVYYI